MLGLLVLSPTTLIILNKPTHQVILSGQQLLQANERVIWWWWVTTTWDLATPMINGSLRDVEDRVLRSPCAHHLSY
jgi:hypothetical protein